MQWETEFRVSSAPVSGNAFQSIQNKGENIMSTATVKGQYSRDEADIRALIETVHKAHHSKDAAAIVAPYARAAAVFSLAPPLSHIGMDLEEKKAWLDTWEGPIDLESRDLSITVSGDFAFCHGFYRNSGTPKAAGRPISFWMRATVCLHRDGGAWRIVHEHTSVPFYMDGSLRPAFDLKP
jgi:ketosteroid isomerase-like protein